MARGYERWQVMHDSTVSSTYTSNPVLTVDLASISLSWRTNTTASSPLTVQGTLDNGFSGLTLVENSWSLLTAATSQGLVTIDPGIRWIRTIAGSADSTATVILQGWS